MKRLIFILLVTQFVSFYGDKLQEGSSNSELFTKNNAEKILGQPVKLITKKKEAKDGVIRTDISYTSLQNNPNRTVNIYYLLKKHGNSSLAKNAYLTAVKNNAGLSGQTLRSGIGDEAFYHSDSVNFGLLTIRKNEYLLLIKVNKMTNKFSKEVLEKVAKRIALAL